MNEFVLDWSAAYKIDDCVFCGKPVLANQTAGHWWRSGVQRTVHAACRPVCAEFGVETINRVVERWIRPDLTALVTMSETRWTPCWSLNDDGETICAYHRWAKTAKPGDVFL